MPKETSKIPIKEIEKASKEKRKVQREEKKVLSPYTLDDKPKSKLVPIVITLIILLLLTLIGYIVVTQYVIPEDSNDNDIITYLEN